MACLFCYAALTLRAADAKAALGVAPRYTVLFMHINIDLFTARMTACPGGESQGPTVGRMILLAIRGGKWPCLFCYAALTLRAADAKAALGVAPRFFPPLTS